MTFKIEGVSQLMNALQDLGSDETRKLIRNSNHALASKAAKQIETRAPVHPVDVVKYGKGDKKKVTKSGTLKRAIKAKRRKPTDANRKFQSNVVVTEGNKAKDDAYFWKWVEYGTVKMPAQPFINPVKRLAAQSAEEDMKAAVIKKTINRFNRLAKT